MKNIDLLLSNEFWLSKTLNIILSKLLIINIENKIFELKCRPQSQV